VVRAGHEIAGRWRRSRLLGELLFDVIKIPASVRPDEVLVELGEAHPVFCTVGRSQATTERRTLVGPIRAEAVAAGQQPNLLVDGYLEVLAMYRRLKVTGHVLEQEEPVVLGASPAADLIGHGQDAAAGNGRRRRAGASEAGFGNVALVKIESIPRRARNAAGDVIVNDIELVGKAGWTDRNGDVVGQAGIDNLNRGC